MRGDPAAQVGSDQRALDDLAVAVGDHRIAHLEFIDDPAIGAADATFRLAFGGHRGCHIGTLRHELRGERASGEGLLDVQCLPAAFELVDVAVAAQVVPDVFDGNVERALEQAIRHLRTAVGEALALPFRGVEQDLFLRLLDLGGGNRRSHQRAADQNLYQNSLHETPLSHSVLEKNGIRRRGIRRLSASSRDDRFRFVPGTQILLQIQERYSGADQLGPRCRCP